jgi:hypothetical protein
MAQSTVNPKEFPGVTDPGADPVAGTLAAIAALPPKRPPVVLPDDMKSAPVPDVVRAIVRQAKPDDEREDQDYIRRLKTQIGGRVNSAQYHTHRGHFDQTKFILETANELREIDRVTCKWSGALRATPAEIHAKVLEKCREVDAWAADGFLLAQHSSLCQVTDPAAARAHVQHLADNARKDEVPCGRTERAQDGLFRFLGEAVEQFQAVQALAVALGTDDTRSAAIQTAIGTANRQKVTQAIAPGMPCHPRWLDKSAKALAADETDLLQTHPRTTQFIELTQRIEVAKAKRQLAYDAEATERALAAQALVSGAEAGRMPDLIELEQRTIGTLPTLSADLRKARASDGALCAVIGFLIHSDDQKRAAVARDAEKMKFLPIAQFA